MLVPRILFNKELVDQYAAAELSMRPNLDGYSLYRPGYSSLSALVDSLTRSTHSTRRLTLIVVAVYAFEILIDHIGSVLVII